MRIFILVILLFASVSKADLSGLRFKKIVSVAQTTGGAAPWTIYTVPANCILKVKILTVWISKGGTTWNGSCAVDHNGVFIAWTSCASSANALLEVVGKINTSAISGAPITTAQGQGFLGGSGGTDQIVNTTGQNGYTLELGPGAIRAMYNTTIGSLNTHYETLMGELYCQP